MYVLILNFVSDNKKKFEFKEISFAGPGDQKDLNLTFSLFPQYIAVQIRRVYGLLFCITNLVDKLILIDFIMIRKLLDIVSKQYCGNENGWMNGFLTE